LASAGVGLIIREVRGDAVPIDELAFEGARAKRFPAAAFVLDMLSISMINIAVGGVCLESCAPTQRLAIDRICGKPMRLHYAAQAARTAIETIVCDLSAMSATTEEY